jgi:DHA1 family bicyclomycin/chloramphenicol resistance-like MFS transporter
MTAEAASMIGYVTMGMSLVPMIGPVIGGFAGRGFRLAGQALLLLLVLGLAVTAAGLGRSGRNLGPEDTSPADQIAAVSRPAGLAAVLGLLRMAAAFSSGCFFAYLGGAPYVGTEVFTCHRPMSACCSP